MSYSDARRMQDLEAAVAELRARVVALEDMVASCKARQGGGTAPGTPGSLDYGIPSQRLSSAPGNDTVMADVIGALRAGQSIRGAADMLGLDRNKVFRLRQRAIAEGCLAVSPTETGQRGAAAAQYAAF